MLQLTCSLALLSGAAALQMHVRPAALASARHAAPSMQFGRGGSTKETLPKGWKKVPSNSRPGKFSYLNTSTGKRYDRIPKSTVYDDEEDTYAGRFAFWKAEESVDEFSNLSDAERAGFTE